jgi:hypothetical protein
MTLDLLKRRAGAPAGTTVGGVSLSKSPVKIAQNAIMYNPHNSSPLLFNSRAVRQRA